MTKNAASCPGLTLDQKLAGFAKMRAHGELAAAALLDRGCHVRSLGGGADATLMVRWDTGATVIRPGEVRAWARDSMARRPPIGAEVGMCALLRRDIPEMDRPGCLADLLDAMLAATKGRGLRDVALVPKLATTEPGPALSMP